MDNEVLTLNIRISSILEAAYIESHALRCTSFFKIGYPRICRLRYHDRRSWPTIYKHYRRRDDSDVEGHGQQYNTTRYCSFVIFNIEFQDLCCRGYVNNERLAFGLIRSNGTQTFDNCLIPSRRPEKFQLTT